MEAPPIEIEAKFAVPQLDPIRRQLLDRSARLVRPRLQETNLRFDDADGRLARQGRVLRLRTNHDTRLTYKAPGPDPEHRLEVELEIDDAAAARQLLEGLGFQVVLVYEKYRETYALGGAQVMLDELPFGLFVRSKPTTSVGAANRRGSACWPERLAPGTRLFKPCDDAMGGRSGMRPSPIRPPGAVAGGRDPGCRTQMNGERKAPRRPGSTTSRPASNASRNGSRPSTLSSDCPRTDLPPANSTRVIWKS
jgi:adenylate cyclase class 2